MFGKRGFVDGSDQGYQQQDAARHAPQAPLRHEPALSPRGAVGVASVEVSSGGAMRSFTLDTPGKFLAFAGLSAAGFSTLMSTLFQQESAFKMIFPIISGVALMCVSVISTITIDTDRQVVIWSKTRALCIPGGSEEFPLALFTGVVLTPQLASFPTGKRRVDLSFSDGRKVSIMPLGKWGYMNGTCLGMERFASGVNNYLMQIRPPAAAETVMVYPAAGTPAQ